ncbi:MAG: ATP-binding cassette domain-containing protein [Deltaproteobacteria bacterium]|nr:ATP-binding cassette domain-containing protein [Deltaproteobacteria bacterium]
MPRESATEPLLRLSGVRKRLGSTQALDGVDLHLAPGEVVGLLGPNGAGKTTLVRLLLDLLRPDSGTVEVVGHHPAERPRASVGYLPEERGLYPKVRVLPLLTYLVSLSGLSPAEARRRSREWLERVDLADRARARADTLSKGMQQKVQLGAAILAGPRLVILDEPFTGLDPVGRRLVAEVVGELKARGAAVLISSHLLDQVQQLCDRVVLVRAGKVLLEGEVGELRARYGAGRYLLDAGEGSGPVIERLATVEGETRGTLQLRLAEGVDERALLRALIEAEVEVRSFARCEPSLEEIFIEAVLEAQGTDDEALRARLSQELATPLPGEEESPS